MLVASLPHEDLVSKDHHGMTALHIAAMRNNNSCVKILLEAGVPDSVKSTSGWLPIQEASAYRSLAAFNTLAEKSFGDVTDVLTQKANALRAVVSGMPDCAFQVRNPRCTDASVRTKVTLSWTPLRETLYFL